MMVKVFQSAAVRGAEPCRLNRLHTLHGAEAHSCSVTGYIKSERADLHEM